MFDQFGNMCLDVFNALQSLNSSTQFDEYLPIVLLECKTILYGLLTLALFVVTMLFVPILCGVIWATDFIKTRYLKHCLDIRNLYDPVADECNKQRNIIGHANTSRKEKIAAYKKMCDILKEHNIPYDSIDLDSQSLDVVLASMPKLRDWPRKYLPVNVTGDFAALNDPAPYKTFQGMRAADVAFRVLLTVLVLAIYVIFFVPVLFILF